MIRTTSGVGAADSETARSAKVLGPKFHAVAANPPYITEKDSARKEYHREKIGKSPRYVSAYREYDENDDP